MGKIRYGVIGSGWRAEFYIRIAKAVTVRYQKVHLLSLCITCPGFSSKMNIEIERFSKKSAAGIFGWVLFKTQ